MVAAAWVEVKVMKVEVTSTKIHYPNIQMQARADRTWDPQRCKGLGSILIFKVFPK